MSVISTFFGYKPLDTFMHRFDGRVKFLLYLAFVISAVAWSDPIYLLCLLAVVLICGKLAKDYFSSMIKTILIPFPGYIMILLFNIFAFDYTVKQTLSWTPLYIGWAIPKIGSFGPYGHVSIEGLTFTLGVCLRLGIFILASRLFLRVASPSDIVAALEKLKIPLSITMAISVAFGYLPELARQVSSILEAQKVRGWNIKTKNPFKVAKAFAPIVVPIVTRSMTRAEFIAAAMVSRGFGASSKRLSLKEIKFTKKDYIATAILLTFLGVSILIGIWVLNIANFRFTSFLIRSLLSQRLL